MLLSMTPLHLLGHNDQNKVKHDSAWSCYAIGTSLLSHDVDGISTAPFHSLCQKLLK